MTKTLNQIFFFLHQNQNIFFSNIGNQNIFFRKKPEPPTFKLNGRSLSGKATNINFSLRFDPVGDRTHDLPQLRRLQKHEVKRENMR